MSTALGTLLGLPIQTQNQAPNSLQNLNIQNSRIQQLYNSGQISRDEAFRMVGINFYNNYGRPIESGEYPQFLSRDPTPSFSQSVEQASSYLSEQAPTPTPTVRDYQNANFDVNSLPQLQKPFGASQQNTVIPSKFLPSNTPRVIPTLNKPLVLDQGPPPSIARDNIAREVEAQNLARQQQEVARNLQQALDAPVQEIQRPITQTPTEMQQQALDLIKENRMINDNVDMGRVAEQLSELSPEYREGISEFRSPRGPTSQGLAQDAYNQFAGINKGPPMSTQGTSQMRPVAFEAGNRIATPAADTTLNMSGPLDTVGKARKDDYLKPVYKQVFQAAPPIDANKFKFDTSTKEGRTAVQQMLVNEGINLAGSASDAGVIQTDRSKAMMPTSGVGVSGPRTKTGIKTLQKKIGVKPTGVWDDESALRLAAFKRAQQPGKMVTSTRAMDSSLPQELSFAQAPQGVSQPQFAPEKDFASAAPSAGAAAGQTSFLDKPGAKELMITGGLVGAEALRSLMGGFGPAATYAKKRVSELEKEGKDDFRDRALEKEERQEGMAAIRGLGESTLREQEKALAMSPRTSAGRLQRMREGAQRELYKASLGLERDVQARKGQRAMQKQRELESLYQYQQQQRDAGLNRLMAGATQLAGQYGKIQAAQAQLEQFDPIAWSKKFQEAGWSKADAQKQAMRMAEIGANQGAYDMAMKLINTNAQPNDPRWGALGLTQSQKDMKQLMGQ